MPQTDCDWIEEKIVEKEFIEIRRLLARAKMKLEKPSRATSKS